MTLRYLTAGESHGVSLTGILDGMPAGVEVRPEDFAGILRRRRCGYGRGARQQIERDQVRVSAGLSNGSTTGSPIAMHIDNAAHSDFAAAGNSVIDVPLPGHADLAGVIKYQLNDCRNIRERASARETAMRAALSVPPRCLLSALGIGSLCLLESIDKVEANIDYFGDPQQLAKAIALAGDDFLTPDSAVIPAWKSLIDQAAAENRSLGGTAAVIFWNLPFGLGSHTQYDLRLDARLAELVMSIPAVRGVETGLALKQARGCCPGADPVAFSEKEGWVRSSNYAGGIEGGMTDGAPLILRMHMKPLPANAGLPSVNLQSGVIARPDYYRSDTQALTAAAVVAESLVAIELASQLLLMTGGSTLFEIRERLAVIRRQQKRLPG